VNGERVSDLGRQVDPETDAIEFRGRLLEYQRPIYYILNKPEGYLTSVSDPHHTRTVFELLPRKLVSASRDTQAARTRVFPVGRLDLNSSGLLLFTNDGDLANRLTHPRYGIQKEYWAKLNHAYKPEDIRRLLQGVSLSDGMARANRVVPVSQRILRVWISEGKKREIRRMFAALGYDVVRLKREAFGPVGLGPLALGRGRFLNQKEIQALKNAVRPQPRQTSRGR